MLGSLSWKLVTQQNPQRQIRWICCAATLWVAHLPPDTTPLYSAELDLGPTSSRHSDLRAWLTRYQPLQAIDTLMIRLTVTSVASTM